MSEREETKIEIAIVDEVSSESLAEISNDVLEVGIDSLMDEGVLRDLPVVGSIYKMGKVVLGVRESLFMKKILRFMSKLKDVPLHKRVEFVSAMNDDLEFKQRVGEKIILVLDRMDDMEKPLILGNLFKAYIEGKLKYDEFARLASSVGKCDIIELKTLYKHRKDSRYISDEICQTLAYAGLMSINIETSSVAYDIEDLDSSIYYLVNDLGQKLIKYGFEPRQEQTNHILK